MLLLIPEQASIEFIFVSLYHCLPLLDTPQELGPSAADFSASWITCCTGTGKHDVTATHRGEMGAKGTGIAWAALPPYEAKSCTHLRSCRAPFQRSGPKCARQFFPVSQESFLLSQEMGFPGNPLHSVVNVTAVTLARRTRCRYGSFGYF